MQPHESNGPLRGRDGEQRHAAMTRRLLLVIAILAVAVLAALIDRWA